MKIHENLSLESIVYLDNNGIIYTEIWKDIPEYEDMYQVSDLGRVKSLSREMWNGFKFWNSKEIILKQGFNMGYLFVNLSKLNKTKGFRVHQLVGICFLGHKICKYEFIIDHIDNNPLNNFYKNLQIVSPRINLSKDRVNKTSKFTGVVKSGNKFSASLNYKGKTKHLGTFETEIEASKYYENAVKSINENKEIVSKIKNKSSIYKNVYFDKRSGRFKFFIDFKEKRINRSFNSEIEAFLGLEKFKKENGIL